MFGGSWKLSLFYFVDRQKGFNCELVDKVKTRPCFLQRGHRPIPDQIQDRCHRALSFFDFTHALDIHTDDSSCSVRDANRLNVWHEIDMAI